MRCRILSLQRSAALWHMARHSDGHLNFTISVVSMGFGCACVRTCILVAHRRNPRIRHDIKILQYRPECKVNTGRTHCHKTTAAARTLIELNAIAIVAIDLEHLNGISI